MQCGARPRILCVDDKATAEEMRLLKMVLEKSGYSVLSTSSAQDAIWFFQMYDFDLVLTEDIGIKDESRTCAGILKRMKPHVPVAIYSGGWGPSTRDLQMADRFITKLVTIDELNREIDTLLSMGQARQAA